MKRIDLICLLCYLLPLGLAAQSGAVTGDNENLQNLAANDNTMTVRTYDNRYEGVKGHPYLFEAWKPGEFTTNTGIHYKQVKLKYDMYKDELSLQKSNSEVIVLFNEYVASFTIESTPFVLVGNDDGNHFYQVLVPGNRQLLAKRKKQLLKANYQGAYSADRPYDEFIPGNSTYFLQDQDGNLTKIKGNAKSVAAALGISDKQIKSDIKEKKYDLKQESDLVELIAAYVSQ